MTLQVISLSRQYILKWQNGIYLWLLPSLGGVLLAGTRMDTAEKCRTIFGATTAPDSGILSHLSDGSAAPTGFRDIPALSSRDGKGTGEETRG